MARPAAIQPVASAMAANHMKFLIYGEPGAGKSVLAGTSPNALILANNPDEVSSAAIQGSKADMWVINDYNDLTEAYEYMRHEGCRSYDWCWMDNGTLFQEQGMDQIMLDLVIAKPHRSQWVPDQAEYLVNQNRLGTLIRNFTALPIHFGITAHVMHITTEDGDDEAWPLFQGGKGNYSQKICGYMGVLGYMKRELNKEGVASSTLYVAGQPGRYVAKDRYGVLPIAIKNPTMPQMIGAIKKALPGATLGGGRPAPLGVAKSAGVQKAAGVAKKVSGLVKKTN